MTTLEDGIVVGDTAGPGSATLMGTWLSLSGGFAQRLISESFGLAQDARTECHAIVRAGLDLGETLAKGITHIVRSTVDRVDTLCSDALRRSEANLSSVVQTLHATGHEALGFAARATRSVAGPAQDPPQPTN
jgi:hypothetical protein